MTIGTLGIDGWSATFGTARKGLGEWYPTQGQVNNQTINIKGKGFHPQRSLAGMFISLS